MLLSASVSYTERKRSARMGASAFSMKLSHILVTLSRTINQLNGGRDLDKLEHKSHMLHGQNFETNFH